MRKLKGVGILALSASFGCGSWFGMLDLDKETYYGTYEEAITDGMETRGWMPAFMPKSATEIHEYHNLDSNAQWLTFRFGEEDLASIKAALEASEDGSAFRQRRSQAAVAWWPADIGSGRGGVDLSYWSYRQDSRAAGVVVMDEGALRLWFFRWPS